MSGFTKDVGNMHMFSSGCKQRLTNVTIDRWSSCFRILQDVTHIVGTVRWKIFTFDKPFYYRK